jgi:flagellar biosynthesis/type III secretory pathway chaperone
VNDLFFSLIECLKEEAAVCHRLIVLIEAQKELLIAGKTEALPDNARAQEKQLFVLTPIAGTRNELLAKIAKTSRVKSMTLLDVVKSAPGEIAQDLQKAMDELNLVAKKMEQANQVNEKLLRNALSFADFTLKVIRDGGRQRSFASPVAKDGQKSSFMNRVV